MVEGGAADKEQLQTLLAADRLRYMIEGVGEADKDQLQTMLVVDRLWYMIGDILSCFYGIVSCNCNASRKECYPVFNVWLSELL